MKSLFYFLGFLFCCSACFGRAVYDSKEDLISRSDIIAIFRIQELRSMDLSKHVANLVAKGYFVQAIKGADLLAEIEKENGAKGFEFIIPQFFPCASFDVSTGKHIVFLRRHKDKIVGTNWENSYLYISGDEAKWYSPDGKGSIATPTSKIIEDIKSIVESQKAEPDSSIKSEAAPRSDTPKRFEIK